MYKIIFLALILINGNCFSQKQPDWVSKTGARSFPSGKKIFTVNDYGAVSDTTTINSKFIQKAIDDCAAKGGGIVVFKPGTYVTGALFLKTNVQLRIHKGVLLLGSQHFEDYPEIDTRIAGIEMKWPAALINVIGQKTQRSRVKVL